MGVARAQRMRPVTWAWLLGLIAWTTLLSFYGIGGGAGLEPVDCWVAQTAREMYENAGAQGWRGLATPYFSEELFLQKSPGPYWAVCLTAFLRGTEVDTVSARVPGAIAAILLVVTVFWLAQRIAGDRPAVFAGFATAASVGLLYWSHRPSADLGVATLMTMSLACLWVASECEPPGRKRVALWLLGYFLAGLAMIYKMPMPIVCVGLPAFLYVLLRKRWRIFVSPWHLVGLALFLLPWLPWALWVISQIPIAVDKWRTEFWDRITGDLPNVEAQLNWYVYPMYVGVALLLAIPFSLSLPQAVVRAFRPAPGVNRNGQWFLLIWFLSLLAFFTVSVGKETRYFWPVFVLLGIELAAFFDPQRRRAPSAERLGFWSVVVLLPAGLLVGGLLYLRNWHEKTFPEGGGNWNQVLVAGLVAAAVFAGGAILAAWLFRRRRANESFAALVATTWLTWLWVWPTLMPKLGSQMPFTDFAQQLVTLTPEQLLAPGGAPRPAHHLVQQRPLPAADRPARYAPNGGRQAQSPMGGKVLR
jgi:4-amino-4-deoxy-L-arabinose transferase-like glycosyltransferase